MREEFLNKIVEAIKEKVGTECKVLLRKVKKNNGLVLQAIEIWEPVPDNGMDKDELRAIVRMINSREVPEDEVLSENVYRYCRKEKRLVIA